MFYQVWGARSGKRGWNPRVGARWRHHPPRSPKSEKIASPNIIIMDLSDRDAAEHVDAWGK